MSNVITYFGHTGSGGFVETLTSNSGGGVGATLNNINVVGGNNITGVGVPATSTITLSLTGTTNNALQVGNSSGSLTSLAVAGNGQIPIGSVGANPVIANISAGPGISIANGAGSITISASGTSTLNYTAVSTTPYVVAATDDFLGVTTSSLAITIDLPNAPATGRVYSIKDVSGNAGVNNITVTTVGGAVLIDGAVTFVMNTAYEAINVLFNGTAYLIF